MFFDCYFTPQFLNWYYVLKLTGCGQPGEAMGVRAREIQVIIDVRKRAHSFKNILIKEQTVLVLRWNVFFLIPK
jgi:hypothetical protein